MAKISIDKKGQGTNHHSLSQLKGWTDKTEIFVSPLLQQPKN